MRLLANHLVLMAIYAALTGCFFALLTRHEKRARLRTFGIVAGALFMGGVAIAWVMYPFPLK